MYKQTVIGVCGNKQFGPARPGTACPDRVGVVTGHLLAVIDVQLLIHGLIIHPAGRLSAVARLPAKDAAHSKLTGDCLPSYGVLQVSNTS
jgi:hypothetical protein